MRIRIVSYEFGQNWILTKFADNLCGNLRALGHEADVAERADPAYDVNHHIIYLGYNHLSVQRDKEKNPSLHTLMITHVDSWEKIRLLKNQLQSADLGICMSSHTQAYLLRRGIPRKKLCYILPAHDSLFVPSLISIGIFTRTYPDGRKNEKRVIDIAKKISPTIFLFKIMGSGWDEIVSDLKELGFTVEYHPVFDREKYADLLPSVDYYLYLGWDEGSMGFLDALAAGIRTIVTPQGFHLDIKGGIDCDAKDTDTVIRYLLDIQHRRESLARQLSLLTWRAYAEKHLAVWEYLRGNTIALQGNSPDGIHSIGKPSRFYFLPAFTSLGCKEVTQYVLGTFISYLRKTYLVLRSLLSLRKPFWLKRIIRKIVD